MQQKNDKEFKIKHTSHYRDTVKILNDVYEDNNDDLIPCFC